MIMDDQSALLKSSEMHNIPLHMREAFQSMWGIGKKSADLMTYCPLFDYVYLMLEFLELNFQS